MKTFEYTITIHPVETFKKVAFFCGQNGQCSMEEVPSDQLKTLEDILNGRGRGGWELVDINVGNDGLLAFWKREAGEIIDAGESNETDGKENR
ncbi:MAG: hypothetical protein JW884_09205 [Deltaproteobacteria bacterium]|nr:hypothetical protein [Deltaproteobacteria bacterium]